MKIVTMKNYVGDFAENKEMAKELRTKQIIPALEKEESITIDFDGVMGATQSFIHALISDPIRKYGDIFFDNIFYRNTNEEIQKIITIVYNYMQESL